MAELPLEWLLGTLVVVDPCVVVDAAPALVGGLLGTLVVVDLCVVVDAAPALVGEYKSSIFVATGPHS